MLPSALDPNIVDSVIHVWLVAFPEHAEHEKLIRDIARRAPLELLYVLENALAIGFPPSLSDGRLRGVCCECGRTPLPKPDWVLCTPCLDKLCDTSVKSGSRHGWVTRVEPEMGASPMYPGHVPGRVQCGGPPACGVCRAEERALPPFEREEP